MDDVTLPELARRLDTVDRRFNDYARKEVYEADMRSIRSDIAEIKESNKWAMRLIAAQFVTLVVALLAYFATNWPA